MTALACHWADGRGSRVLAREPISHALFDEMMPLLERHWKEVAHYGDIPLEPDRAMYLTAEANGALRVFTVRNDRGRLVGYAFFFVRHNPHYLSSLQAVQDVIYVETESRGRTGSWFITACEDALRAEGVQAVYHHVKTAHNWGKLLERKGYEAVDVIYAKRLDRPMSPQRAVVIDEASNIGDAAFADATGTPCCDYQPTESGE